jgi:hypothetical protein
MHPRSSNNPLNDPAPSFERRTLSILAAVLPRSARQRQIHEWRDHLACTHESGGDTRRELLSLARSTAPIAWNAHVPRYLRVGLNLLAAAAAATLLLWTAGSSDPSEPVPTVTEDAATLSKGLVTTLDDFLRRGSAPPTITAEVNAIWRLCKDLFELDCTRAEIRKHLGQFNQHNPYITNVDLRGNVVECRARLPGVRGQIAAEQRVTRGHRWAVTAGNIYAGQPRPARCDKTSDPAVS